MSGWGHELPTSPRGAGIPEPGERAGYGIGGGSRGSGERRAEADLAGTRVLDLSESAPGRYSTRLTADYGASVLLVNPPAGSRV